MTLESQIQQFIDTAKPDDLMLLSKDGDLKSGTGLSLKRFPNSFDLFFEGGHIDSWGLRAPAEWILQRALLWSYRTGKELASPDPEARVRGLLVARCQCRDMSEGEAQNLLSDILGDLADWMDQRHASPQTAEIIRAIFP